MANKIVFSVDNGEEEAIHYSQKRDSSDRLSTVLASVSFLIIGAVVGIDTVVGAGGVIGNCGYRRRLEDI